ncbi:hypothetical protein HYU15_01935, partial [Candidatus Woesearchaeota archaeon]|nr:hypothetical protein [Candidatus Woesearchaeota archaeon]
MPSQETREITTGVDKLVALLNEKKRISINDAAKDLSMPKVVIEEWADFLHEQGVIEIDYKFATPFLVKRELTRDEAARNSKDFEGRKEGFVRKVEAMIEYIDRESSGLKKVRGDFRKLSAELEEDVKKVRADLATLENYEKLKRGIDREIVEQQQAFKKQMDSMNQQILARQKSYDELVRHIKEQELKIDEEVSRTELIRKNEEILKDRLRKIEQAAELMEKEIKKEDADVAVLKGGIGRMKRFAENLRKGIEMRKNDIMPLIEKSRAHEKRIEEMQNRILEKVVQKRKEIGSAVSESKAAKEKFERFFDEKVSIDTLMDKVDTD